MTNKPWTRNELILALDTYFTIQPQTPDPALPQMQDLSDLLNRFPVVGDEERAPNYRSIASVVMKMMNFRSLDPAYSGSGLRASGKRDREVWQEFSENRINLRAAAVAIRSALAAEGI